MERAGASSKFKNFHRQDALVNEGVYVPEKNFSARDRFTRFAEANHGLISEMSQQTNPVVTMARISNYSQSNPITIEMAADLYERLWTENTYMPKNSVVSNARRAVKYVVPLAYMYTGKVSLEWHKAVAEFQKAGTFSTLETKIKLDGSTKRCTYYGETEAFEYPQIHPSLEVVLPDIVTLDEARANEFMEPVGEEDMKQKIDVLQFALSHGMITREFLSEFDWGLLLQDSQEDFKDIGKVSPLDSIFGKTVNVSVFNHATHRLAMYALEFLRVADEMVDELFDWETFGMSFLMQARYLAVRHHRIRRMEVLIEYLFPDDKLVFPVFIDRLQALCEEEHKIKQLACCFLAYASEVAVKSDVLRHAMTNQAMQEYALRVSEGQDPVISCDPDYAHKTRVVFDCIHMLMGIVSHGRDSGEKKREISMELFQKELAGDYTDRDLAEALLQLATVGYVRDRPGEVSPLPPVAACVTRFSDKIELYTRMIMLALCYVDPSTGKKPEPPSVLGKRPGEEEVPDSEEEEKGAKKVRLGGDKALVDGENLPNKMAMLQMMNVFEDYYIQWPIMQKILKIVQDRHPLVSFRSSDVQKALLQIRKLDVHNVHITVEEAQTLQSLLPYRMIGKFRRIGEDRARDMHKMNAKKKMRELIDAKPEEVEKKVREYAEMMYDYLVTDGGDMSVGWIMSHSIHLHLIPAVSTGRFYRNNNDIRSYTFTNDDFVRYIKERWDAAANYTGSPRDYITRMVASENTSIGADEADIDYREAALKDETVIRLACSDGVQRWISSYAIIFDSDATDHGGPAHKQAVIERMARIYRVAKDSDGALVPLICDRVDVKNFQGIGQAFIPVTRAYLISRQATSSERFQRAKELFKLATEKMQPLKGRRVQVSEQETESLVRFWKAAPVRGNREKIMLCRAFHENGAENVDVYLELPDSMFDYPIQKHAMHLIRNLHERQGDRDINRIGAVLVAFAISPRFFTRNNVFVDPGEFDHGVFINTFQGSYDGIRTMITSLCNMCISPDRKNVQRLVYDEFSDIGKIETKSEIFRVIYDNIHTVVRHNIIIKEDDNWDTAIAELDTKIIKERTQTVQPVSVLDKSTKWLYTMTAAERKFLNKVIKANGSTAFPVYRSNAALFYLTLADSMNRASVISLIMACMRELLVPLVFELKMSHEETITFISQVVFHALFDVYFRQRIDDNERPVLYDGMVGTDEFKWPNIAPTDIFSFATDPNEYHEVVEVSVFAEAKAFEEDLFEEGFLRAFDDNINSGAVRSVARHVELRTGKMCGSLNDVLAYETEHKRRVWVRSAAGAYFDRSKMVMEKASKGK